MRRIWEVKRITKVFYGALFCRETPNRRKVVFRKVERGGLLGNISNVTYTVGIWPEILFRPEARHSQHFSLCELEQH